MPRLYQAQVRIAADSTIPADASVNTWHFRIADSATLTDTDLITGQRDGGPDEQGPHGDLSDFYSTIGGIYSEQVDWTKSSIKWTNLDDPMPRVPLLDIPLDPVPANVTGGAMPSEVAICASFEAEKLAGLNQARRRNRVFLGPLGQGVVNPAVQRDGRLSQVNMTLIADAMENLASNSAAQGAYIWVVYSPTDNDNHSVQNGWVDNAFDTQRRRGVEPSIRTTWEQSAV